MPQDMVLRLFRLTLIAVNINSKQSAKIRFCMACVQLKKSAIRRRVQLKKVEIKEIDFKTFLISA